jgi:hypothetical protein
VTLAASLSDTDEGVTCEIAERPDERCPKCGTAHPLLVCYGLPSDELSQMADRGDVRLGGSNREPTESLVPRRQEYFCKSLGANRMSDRRFRQVRGIVRSYEKVAFENMKRQ